MESFWNFTFEIFLYVLQTQTTSVYCRTPPIAGPSGMGYLSSKTILWILWLNVPLQADNFEMKQAAIHKQLDNLKTLLQYVFPRLYHHFGKTVNSFKVQTRMIFSNVISGDHKLTSFKYQRCFAAPKF